MDYKFIQDNYFIASTACRFGKEILVCRSKKNLVFSYFYVDAFEYCEADDKLTEKLNKIYKLTTSPDFNSLKIKNNSAIQNDNKQIENSTLDCINKFKKYLESVVPQKEYELAKKRIDNIKIVYAAYNKFLAGQFMPLINTIKIFDSNDDNTNFSSLYHEMFHSIGRGHGQTTGFMYSFEQNIIDALLKVTSSFYGNVNNTIGIGVEEASTVYFTEKFISDAHGGYYDLSSTFSKLAKFLDDGEILKYKINNDLVGFVNYVTKEFHEKSNERVLDLVVKMDAYRSVLNGKKKMPNDLDLYELNNISLSMTKIITELAINKLQHEKKQVSNLNYQSLFGDSPTYLSVNAESMIVKNVFNEYIEQINNYIKHIVSDSNDKLLHELDIKQIAKYYLYKPSKSLSKLITNNGFLIPQQYKSAVTLMSVINSIDAANWLIVPVTLRCAKSAIAKHFLNPLRGFMPKDLQERKNFYQSIMEISSTLNFNVFKKIPLKSVQEIMIENDALIANAVRKNADFTFDSILSTLPKSVILQKKFVILDAIQDLKTNIQLIYIKKLVTLTEPEKNNVEINQ